MEQAGLWARSGRVPAAGERGALTGSGQVTWVGGGAGGGAPGGEPGGGASGGSRGAGLLGRPSELRSEEEGATLEDVRRR